jgi:hypothetical protein
MRNIAKRLTCGLAVCGALLLIPAAAGAEVRTGSVTDPAGDAAFPQSDITAVEFSYDTAGTMSAKMTLAAPPDADLREYGMRIGPSSGGPECNGPSVNGLVHTPSGLGEVFGPGGMAIANPTASVQGNTVSIQASDPSLANQAWDCGFGVTFFPGSDVADTTPPATLVAAAPPPPPPPPPPAQPKCTIKASKVKRGRKLGVSCTGVTGKLTVKFQRKGKKARKVTARVSSKGRASFSTRGLRRGKYKVTVSQNGKRLATRTVRVR